MYLEIIFCSWLSPPPPNLWVPHPLKYKVNWPKSGEIKAICPESVGKANSECQKNAQGLSPPPPNFWVPHPLKYMVISQEYAEFEAILQTNVGKAS